MWSYAAQCGWIGDLPSRCQTLGRMMRARHNNDFHPCFQTVMQRRNTHLFPSWFGRCSGRSKPQTDTDRGRKCRRERQKEMEANRKAFGPVGKGSLAALNPRLPLSNQPALRGRCGPDCPCYNSFSNPYNRDTSQGLPFPISRHRPLHPSSPPSTSSFLSSFRRPSCIYFRVL